MTFETSLFQEGIAAMNQPAQAHAMMTVAEYLAFADARPMQRFELLAGEPVAMAPGTLRHSLIAGNIDTSLRGQIRDRGCTSYRDAGIAHSDDADFLPEPDVMVRCGPVDDRRRWVPDPVVVIEVLSPSTMADDRGYKLKAYMAFASLRHLVLVYQDEMRIEHWSRPDDLAWSEAPQVLNAPDDRLLLSAVEAGLSLSEIYAGVTLR
ncbi:Uma2 family endonuclease [Alsobacter sp. SYSU BS001988]